MEFTRRVLPDPLRGPDATGLGKPLRSILHGRADLPIYLAAVGPRNVALAAEIADGWIPVFFSARAPAAVPRVAERGLQGRRAAAEASGFDVMPMVSVVVGDDWPPVGPP